MIYLIRHGKKLLDIMAQGLFLFQFLRKQFQYYIQEDVLIHAFIIALIQHNKEELSEEEQ